MIVRYLVKCDHCAKVTAFKIAVGCGDRDPFRFECRGCSQVIQGVHEVDQQNFGGKDLSVEGGTVVPYGVPHDFMVTYDPQFPSSDNTVREDFSPFLQAMTRHGGARKPLTGLLRSRAFAEIASAESRSVARIIRNYQSGDWKNFETGVKKYVIGSEFNLHEAIDKEEALYRFIEFVVGAVVAAESHVSFVKFLGDYVFGLLKDKRPEMNAYLAAVAAAGYARRVQKKAFDLVPRLLDMHTELLPVLSEWNPEDPDAVLPDDLRVEPRRDFHEIKSLYVDAYELTCKSLTLVTGLINIMLRGAHDTYMPDPNAKKAKPSPLVPSMAKFDEMDHARKIELLREEPRFHAWLAKSFDSKLRNSIGHYAISYDGKANTVTYTLDKAGTVERTITFANFLFNLLRAFTRAHQANRLVKTLSIAEWGSRTGAV